MESKITELKKEVQSLNMKNDGLSGDLLRVQKMSGITEENQRLEIAALTDRCVRVTHMLEAESALRRQCEDRANRFDLAETELQILRKEVFF
jgi:hypothetical protein